MLTLGIDTTATAASAALVKDGDILSEFNIRIGLQHSRTLMPMVESLFSCCGIPLGEVERIAVTVGPGSFTGVRIGVSAVKGLAFPKDIPCVGLSTLEVLANNIPETDCLICPVMDARCNQVYNALFRYEDGKPVRLCDDRAIAIADLQEELKSYNQSVVWLGDGALLCYNALENKEGHCLAPEHLRYQKAAQVALLGENATETISSHSLDISYLRPPQAVRARMENK